MEFLFPPRLVFHASFFFPYCRCSSEVFVFSRVQIERLLESSRRRTPPAPSSRFKHIFVLLLFLAIGSSRKAIAVWRHQRVASFSV
jgi:hypothetical protein